MLQIIPLDECTPDQWRSLDPYAPDDERQRSAVAELVAHRDELDPSALLLAIDDGEIVGRLAGRYLDITTYRILEIVSSQHDAASIDIALVASLCSNFRAEHVHVLVTDSERDRRARAALEGAGFEVDYYKALYHRDIAGYRSPYEDPMRYRSLAEETPERFAAVLAAATVGDPLHDSHAPSTLEWYIELAEGAFDARRWKIASLDGVDVGVILPQVFPDLPTEGTLYNIGLLPEYRGRGLGPILHADGLETLAADVPTYVGSTHGDNAAMRRVFERNGCRQTRLQFFMSV